MFLFQKPLLYGEFTLMSKGRVAKVVCQSYCSQKCRNVSFGLKFFVVSTEYCLPVFKG